MVLKLHRKFSSNRKDSTVFEKIEKVRKMFFGHFGASFCCLSDHRHTILMTLHIKDPNLV